MAQDVFTKSELEDALKELASRLSGAGVKAGVRIVGGAALALVYYERQPTMDIDALIYPPLEAEAPVLAMAAEMADEHGWRSDWLNTHVRAWAPPVVEAEWRPLISEGGVAISVAPPDLPLVMKLNAARGVRDAKDIDVLLKLVSVASVEQAQEIFEAYYPGEVLRERAVGAVKRYLDELN
jgi:hypothetical protein